MPSGTRAPSGTWSVFQHGARLQPWSLSSGPGSTSRYSERLHARGATSGTGSLCALRAQGASSGTGLALRRRAPSGKGCAVTHGVRPQRALVPSGKGNAFRNGERIQARGVPSGMVSGFRNWRLCAAGTEPGGAAWDSVPPSLSLPRRLCGESTEPGGCMGFCVSLCLCLSPGVSVLRPQSPEALLGILRLALSVLPLQFLQALRVPTSGTGSEDFRHWEWE